MPATRPLSSEPTGDAEAISHPGPPFTLRFDKLVIAVGAYSQVRRDILSEPIFL